jgi:hypothetical protein
MAVFVQGFSYPLVGFIWAFHLEQERILQQHKLYLSFPPPLSIR